MSDNYLISLKFELEQLYAVHDNQVTLDPIFSRLSAAQVVVFTGQGPLVVAVACFVQAALELCALPHSATYHTADPSLTTYVLWHHDAHSEPLCSRFLGSVTRLLLCLSLNSRDQDWFQVISATFHQVGLRLEITRCRLDFFAFLALAFQSALTTLGRFSRICRLAG